MKKTAAIFEALAVGSSVLLFFYQTSLFERFARAGPTTADAIHNVLINNHGSFSYITADQSRWLQELEIASAVLFGVAIIVDLIRRRYLR